MQADKDLLVAEDFKLGLPSCTKEEAVRFVGELLVERGHVDANYVDGMLEREATVSTYLGNGVSMPHGTFESRDAVHSTGIALAQYPDGIDWGMGTAHLIIGLAATGDDHVLILSKIAEVLQDEEVAESLWTCEDAEFIAQTFAITAEDEDDDESGETDREVTISGEGGLHARPASLIVDFAKTFEGTILIEKDGKSAKATSIMGLLALGATAGDVVQLSASDASNADAEAALDEVERILTTPESEL